jgi:protein ImuB
MSINEATVLVAPENNRGPKSSAKPNQQPLGPLEILPHDPQEDLDQLCHLAEQAQQFSPIVGLEQLDKKLWAGRTVYQPECILLDISGLASHFGGEPKLLERIAQWLYDQRYFGCMAIASTIGAAWAMANFSIRKSPVDQTTGTFRSQHVIVGLCDQENAFARMSIAALRLESETVQTLRRLGISTIGQLDQLPRSGMATRLGQHLLDRWDQLYGRKSESIITLHASPEWNIEQSLEFPTEHRATIAELVSRMSRQLAERMMARGQGAMRIVCRLDLVESPSLILQLSLFRPTAEAAHLQTLLVGQLEQQLRNHSAAPASPTLARYGSRAALWRLSMQATLTAPLVWHQTDLFEGDAIENRHQLARLVDNLSNRLGRRQVLRARVEREPQPENACTLKPMTGRKVDGTEQATIKKLSSRLARKRAEPSVDDPLRRPTRLLSPPQPIEVIASLSEGLPARFKHQQQVFSVVQYWGPERLESGWWRGPSVRRDYFRIETEHGAWWWIYRDMQTNLWYLHGVFD